MLILILTSLTLLALIIGWIIGLFHRKTDRTMKIIIFYLSRCRLNRRHLLRLPRTLKKFHCVLKKRPSLLFLKMRRKYRESKTLFQPPPVQP